MALKQLRQISRNIENEGWEVRCHGSFLHDALLPLHLSRASERLCNTSHVHFTSQPLLFHFVQFTLPSQDARRSWGCWLQRFRLRFAEGNSKLATSCHLATGDVMVQKLDGEGLIFNTVKVPARLYAHKVG